MQQQLKRLVIGLVSLSFLIAISSCGPVKKAQRKARKADKLLREAGMLAPSIMDTIRIVKTDTVIINKDSLRVETRLLLDTVKVDRIIEKLILVKQEGGDVRGLRKEIYEELLPDLHYKSKDSLKITIDEKEHFVRFEMSVVIEDDLLIVTAKPLDNVPFVSITQEINIDAQKKGRFWKGFMWGGISIIIILVALWFLRGVIGAAIKGVM